MGLGGGWAAGLSHPPPLPSHPPTQLSSGTSRQPCIHQEHRYDSPWESCSCKVTPCPPNLLFWSSSRQQKHGFRAILSSKSAKSTDPTKYIPRAPISTLFGASWEPFGKQSLPNHLLLLPKGGQESPQDPAQPNICVPRPGKPPWMRLDHQHFLKTTYFGCPNLRNLINNCNKYVNCY